MYGDGQSAGTRRAPAEGGSRVAGRTREQNQGRPSCPDCPRYKACKGSGAAVVAGYPRQRVRPRRGRRDRARPTRRSGRGYPGRWGDPDKRVVGATGFEPATTCPPCRCATRLRYAPTERGHGSTRINLCEPGRVRKCRGESARPGQACPSRTGLGARPAPARRQTRAFSRPRSRPRICLSSVFTSCSASFLSASPNPSSTCSAGGSLR